MADQADGLRRLLARGGPRVLALAAGCEGVGKTTVAVNLALALAALGRRVLLLDGNFNAGNVNDSLRLRARYELAHAVAGDRRLDQVIVEGPRGVRVLPAARGLAQVAQHPPRAGWLLERLAALSEPPDTILVDAAPDADGTLFALAAPEQELLLVVSPGAHAITAGYGLLKRAAWRGQSRRGGLIVNQADGAEQADAIHRNMAEVARRYAEVRLDLRGWLPADGRVRQAARLAKPLFEALPCAPVTLAAAALAERLAASPPAADGRERSGRTAAAPFHPAFAFA